MPNEPMSLGDRIDLLIAPYVGVFIAAFLITLVATPVMRRLAVLNGVVDLPDRKRKIHAEAVAYLGGVAVFLGWMGGVMVSFFTQPHSEALRGVGHVSFPVSIIIGAVLVTLVGFLDDVYGISPRVKIGGQLLAAAALASQDVGIRLAAQTLEVVGLSAPSWAVYIAGTILIAAFVLGGCNAVNLIDGMDGLATGVTAIAAMGFLYMAVHVAVVNFGSTAELESGFTDPVRLVMCLAIVGCLLGFLPYNFNPATIFLGDAGSLLLGYLSVAAILLFSHAQEDGPRLVMAAMIVLGIPVIDTLLAIVRRSTLGLPLSSPDRQHLHHQLLDRGLSVKKATLVMYVGGASLAALGCGLVYLRWRYVIAVFVVLYGIVGAIAYKRARRQLAIEHQAEVEARLTTATQEPKPSATDAESSGNAAGTQPSPRG